MLVQNPPHHIHIHSSLGQYTGTLDSICVEPPLDYVLACIKHYQPKITQGFDLHITCEFSHTLGFASSAAVVIATLRTIHQWLDMHDITPNQLFDLAKMIKQTIHPVGSGIGLAPAIMNDPIYFNSSPTSIESLNIDMPWVVIYTGTKVKTHTMIDQINAKAQTNPDFYAGLYKDIGDITQQAKTAMEQNDWQQVGQLANAQQQIMVALGVSNPMIILRLRSTALSISALVSSPSPPDGVADDTSSTPANALAMSDPLSRLLVPCRSRTHASSAAGRAGASTEPAVTSTTTKKELQKGVY